LVIIFYSAFRNVLKLVCKAAMILTVGLFTD